MSTPAYAHPPAPERRGRVSAARLRTLGQALNPRDRAVLTDLDRFGFMTTAQLQAVHFSHLQADDRITRRVLKRLQDDGTIMRVDRRVGGFLGGSSTSVWRLSAAGHRLLKDGQRKRIKLPSDRFLDHRLAVADCYVELNRSAQRGRFELLTVAPEPDSWRQYLGRNGSPEVLKPDLYVVTATNDYEDAWFIEIDRGSESLPTVVKQCAQYVRYRRTGKEQQASGVFPYILWVVPNDQRATQLHQAIRASNELPDELFRVTTSASFANTLTGAVS
jgi:hypothetical protein